ncbi:MAG TPA: SprT-like domain-containing protein [Trueperaceae bacterium]
MHLAAASDLARELMDVNGLSAWDFAFDRARRRLGACWPTRQRITLSRQFVELNDEALVRDVILHEIAHALTPGDGHGPRFKRKARELGCNPAACVSEAAFNAAPPRFILECPHCGRTWPRYRRPSARLVCRSCQLELRDRVGELRVGRAA